MSFNRVTKDEKKENWDLKPYWSIWKNSGLNIKTSTYTRKRPCFKDPPQVSPRNFELEIKRNMVLFIKAWVYIYQSCTLERAARVLWTVCWNRLKRALRFCLKNQVSRLPSQHHRRVRFEPTPSKIAASRGCKTQPLSLLLPSERTASTSPFAHLSQRPA